MSNWAVFVDRDGTINEDSGYLGNPEELRLLPRVAEAIKLLNEAGARVIVVSNQSGVARGFFSEEAVRKVDRRLAEELSSQGASVDAFYFCPHHPEIGEEPYRTECQCRKPEPGLLFQAAREHNIDLSHSFMIGDNISDVKAGLNAGCRAILALNGEAVASPVPGDRREISPDYVAAGLYEAAQWIIRGRLLNEKKTG